MIIVVCLCEFMFKVTPAAKVIWRLGHSLKSHPTDWRSLGFNMCPWLNTSSAAPTVVCFLFWINLLIEDFFFYLLSLYSPCHLTYRESGRAIPLHALQTANMVFWLLLGTLAHLFQMCRQMHFCINVSIMHKCIYHAF